MPITTPEKLLNLYGGDRDHFIHVLDHLFKPAVAKIQYDPIPPIAEGSELIHAGIIKQLEMADLVLCDMSALNANVFFELGIRTALDKPICLVKDLVTIGTPFDTSIINFHSYDPSLSPWALPNQIESLSQHLLKSINNSEGTNALWKYFGLSTRARLSNEESGLEAKIDLLTLQIEAIQQQTQEREASKVNIAKDSVSMDDKIQNILSEAQKIAQSISAKVVSWELNGDILILDFNGFIISKDVESRIIELGARLKVSIEIRTERIL